MCTLSITGFTSTIVNSTTTDITVTGTGMTSGGSTCTKVAVTVSCGSNSYTQITSISSGTWSVTITTSCICGDNITINAVCNSGGTCSAATFFGTIICNCCPTFQIVTKDHGCLPNGTRQIEFQVAGNVPQQCGSASMQFNWGDSTLGVIHVFSSGPFSFTELHSYNPSGSPYSVFLNVISPTGCPNSPFSVTVPGCPVNCCPTISALNYNVGACDSNGNRPVTLTATVVPSTNAGCPTPVTLQWDFGDSSSGIVHSVSAPTTIVETHIYNPASSPFTAQLNVLNIAGCSSALITVNVPSCPSPPPCSHFPLNILCALARGIFVFASIIALTFLIVGITFLTIPTPPVPGLPLILLGGLFALGAILALWFVNHFCKPCNPCAWLIHSLGQIFFVTTFTIGLFWSINPTFISVSLILIFLGLGFLFVYFMICNLNQCATLHELFNDVLIAIAMVFFIYFLLIFLFPPLAAIIFWLPPIAWLTVLGIIFGIAIINDNC